MKQTDPTQYLKKVTPKPVRKAVRFCLTSASALKTLVTRTNKSRWKQVSQNPEPHWDWRNKVIAGLVPAGSSVLDVGCGPQTLRRHLDKSCKYQPCDVIKSTPDVIQCDFNAGEYPDPGVTYDVVICSGVIEYIRKPKEFLKRMPALGRMMILSYCPTREGQSRLDRLSVNWVNHYSRAEFDGLLTEMGLKWEAVHTSDEGETIYKIKGKAPRPR